MDFACGTAVVSDHYIREIVAQLGRILGFGENISGFVNQTLNTNSAVVLTIFTYFQMLTGIFLPFFEFSRSI